MKTLYAIAIAMLLFATSAFAQQTGVDLRRYDDFSADTDSVMFRALDYRDSLFVNVSADSAIYSVIKAARLGLVKADLNAYFGGLSVAETGTTVDTQICTWDNAAQEIDCVTTNVPTATALAADPADCLAGNYPLGVNASGTAVNCTPDDDSPDDDSEVPDAISIDQSSTGTFIWDQTTGPTTEGQCAWDATNDEQECGTGAATVVFKPVGSVTDGLRCSWNATNNRIDCASIDDDVPDAGDLGIIDTEAEFDSELFDVESETHKSDHEDGGADELPLENLPTTCTGSEGVEGDGSGGLECGIGYDIYALTTGNDGLVDGGVNADTVRTDASLSTNFTVTFDEADNFFENPTNLVPGKWIAWRVVNFTGTANQPTFDTYFDGAYLIRTDDDDPTVLSCFVLSPTSLSCATNVNRETLIYAFADETTTMTGTGIKTTFHMPYAMQLEEARVGLTGAGTTSGSFTVDVHEAGTTIFGANKISVDFGELRSQDAGTSVDYSDRELADGAKIEVYVDGYTTGGGEKGAKLYLIGILK